MGLAFRLTLPADTQFVRVGEIPAMTAKAIHPESENDSEAQEFARAGCQINHEAALDKAIKSGMVTPLNPLSYEHHTFPYGEALRSAIISLDDFKQFAASLQIEVVIWDAPLPTHLTIVDAAAALSEKYGLTKPDKESLLERLLEAAHRGELVVRDSQGFPYTPTHAEIHYYMLERVSEDDLNAWLKKQGVEYRLDSMEQEQYCDDATVPGRVNNADEIPGMLPPRAVGKLAVKAAWQIECKSGCVASAKEVLALLQAWADEGKEPATLIKSLPDKRAVQWLTAKREHREYTIEACQDTLRKWGKSRQ